MAELTTGPETTSPAALPDQEFAGIYAWAMPLMVGTAVKHFRLPESDAEALAHEILLDFLVKAPGVIDRRGWLLGAICNACRRYRRRAARFEELPDDVLELADPQLSRVTDMWPDQLAAREAFARTTARAQLALRLRYFEGYRISEVAAELGITETYARKLITECLKQAHRRYTGGARK